MTQKELEFSSEFTYSDRKTKQKWVSLRYKPILNGKILDVGADEGYLKEFLAAGVNYIGIGLGGDNSEIIQIDLEKEKIPFHDNEFDCVLCLDVLEHVENIHELFDELCRVSREWIIISLPNPWSVFMSFLQIGKYKEDRNMKFYGLTAEREKDRHKWFFSSGEARQFIQYRAKKNNLEVYDMYIENYKGDGLFTPRNWNEKRKLKKIVKARKHLFRDDLDFTDLYEGTSWWVLRKSKI